VDEVGIGVALDDREALGDALVDALARQLDAAAVDAAPLGEDAQQLAVAAAHVEHLRARLHHVSDHQEVDAAVARDARALRHGQIAVDACEHGHARPLRPRAFPAASRKPRTMANSSGSSSRKASWPLSVVISANDTRAPAALSACTIARDSDV